jgi:hypothetical protein
MPLPEDGQKSPTSVRHENRNSQATADLRFRTSAKGATFGNKVGTPAVTAKSLGGGESSPPSPFRPPPLAQFPHSRASRNPAR